MKQSRPDHKKPKSSKRFFKKNTHISHSPHHHTDRTSLNTVDGILMLTARGNGFVRPLNTKAKDADIMIEPENLNTGLNGDTVRATITSNKNRAGIVTQVLVRSRAGFAGILVEKGGVFVVEPSDPKMYTSITIKDIAEHKKSVGQKVFATITHWTDSKKQPEGLIEQVLGKPGENETEMQSIALERGFVSGFPNEIELEAKALKDREKNNMEYEATIRRDMRNTTTFTIDPFDAKDFDDALSVQYNSDGTYEIGVHIADVSHYVRPGSALDREAFKRATSVYLVDRTIPMLPEILSNDLCSLKQGVDRLTMSAIFTMNTNGEVLSEWYGKTIIHSNKRFTYEEAQEILDNAKENLTERDFSSEDIRPSISHKKTNLHGEPQEEFFARTADNNSFYPELKLLNDIAKKLTASRFNDGAVSLEQDEVKFKLDAKGVPISVYRKVRQDTNKLIEEFMLLANRKVTEHVGHDKFKGERIFLYRIHDKPEADRLNDLAQFLHSLGHDIKVNNGHIPTKDINTLLKKLEGRPERNTVATAIIRAQAKAIYSTENIGHHGLAFDHYTHFTSPIRRYPDVIVHRLIHDYLAGKSVPKKDWPQYIEIARFTSEREKSATDAERASIKYKQVEYMSYRIGETFNGIITGVTEWGIYVEETETKCEGMIQLRSLGDDYYVFDEKRRIIVGQKTKNTFRIGDSMKIRVKNADIKRKIIDYELIR